MIIIITTTIIIIIIIIIISPLRILFHYYVHYSVIMTKSIVFISQLRGLHCNNERNSFFLFCYCLHDATIKIVFLHFAVTFTTP